MSPNHSATKTACEYIWMSAWFLSVLFFIILYLAIIHDYQQQLQQQRQQELEEWLNNIKKNTSD